MSFKLTCNLDLNQFSNQQLINLQNQLTRVIKKRLLKSDPDHVKVTVNLSLKPNYPQTKRKIVPKKNSLTSFSDSEIKSDLDRTLDEIIAERQISLSSNEDEDDDEYQGRHKPHITKEQLDRELDEIVAERDSKYSEYAEYDQ